MWFILLVIWYGPFHSDLTDDSFCLSCPEWRGWGVKGGGGTQGNQQRFSLPRWTKLYHFVHHFWRKRTPLIFNTQEDNSYSADTKQVFKKCWTVNTTYHCIKDESNPKIIFCESNNFHYTSIWKGLWSQGKPPKKVGTLSQTRNRSFLFFWATLRGSSLE